MFFLEGRALLRSLEFALDRLSLADSTLLLRCDNLPFVQAAQRGCSSTRLGNTLVGELDRLVDRCGGRVAVEWVSTDCMLADAFSRVPLGACPAGAGKEGDLVALDHPPCDPLGRPAPTDSPTPSEGARMLCTGAMRSV